MGTMFDLSVLYDEGIWKMYGSWRPNSSIAYSTSQDGFTWDQNLKGALPAWPDAGHTWEQIVNRPFILKRAKGEYLMWY
jgi:beta-1,2-mannobiose phosphorylase / 1,2-beta-oligomannan phosphorylase